MSLWCVQYFTSRLKDPETQARANLTWNGTDQAVVTRSVLEAMFNNVMTLCAMVPLLVFTCLNSVLHHRSARLYYPKYPTPQIPHTPNT